MMPPPPPNSLTVWFVSISFRRRMTFSKDELFAYANWSPKLKGFFRRNFTAAAATPRDDVMLYAKSVQRWKPPMIFSFWGRKHFSKSSKILEVTLRIVCWNPLALAKEDEHRCCLNIHKCSKSQLFWDIIKISVRVIPLLFFNFWIFAPKLFRDRVWMVIYFWQDFISCQVKNQSFSPIASLCCFLFFAS